MKKVFLKKILLVSLSVFLLLTVLFASSASCYTNTIFPQPGSINSSVYTFDTSPWEVLDENGNHIYSTAFREKMYLLSASLQGLVNRGTPKIFFYQNFGQAGPTERNNDFYMEYLKQHDYVISETTYTDIFQMVNDFKSYFSGAVVYDPAKPYTINVATNIAGCENLIIIAPDMISAIQGVGISITRDLRDNNFTDENQAMTWVWNNYWSQQSRDAMGITYYGGPQQLLNRDYLIQFKMHTFWLPGSTDPEYSVDIENYCKYVMQHAPANIPMYGFWFAPAWDNSARGIGEYAGVRLAGQYGKFTIVSSCDGNYSYLSGVQVSDTEFRQQKVRQKAFREYDPTKKYVAITLMESGDSPAYWEYSLETFQWEDPYRGQVPYNYGWTPAARYLLPSQLKYVYETATENDYFFSSISGDGYMYPLDGYGDYGLLDDNSNVTWTKEQLLDDYYRKTAIMHEKLDLDMMGLYTHGGWYTPLNSTDDSLINTYIGPNSRNIVSLIADMGRTEGVTPANGNRWYEDSDLSLHNCMTRWATTTNNFYPPTDTTNDEDAVAWLVDEIRDNSGTGGGFMHCMAYSWNYGPRRLKMVMDELEPEGYEFVTLNELEYLWRYSLDLKLPSRDPNNYFSTEITGATVTASSYFSTDYSPGKAVDNNEATEWATTNADKNAGWIKLTWNTSQAINKVVLQDRVNTNDQITSGILEFSDGSTINVPDLYNSGKPYLIEFPTRNVTWVKFSITSVSGTTYASGLSELSIYNAPMPVYNTDSAKGRSVTSSGIWGSGVEAEKAVDGNNNTRWASNTSGATWIQTALGGVTNINRVKIKWEAAGSYTIWTSQDGVNFTSVKTGTALSNTTTDDTFTTVQAAYVKVTGNSYRSIWSLETYEMPELGTDLAANKMVTSSGIYGSGYEASMAVDVNDNTRWASNTSGASWLSVDLGTKQDINRIKIKWESAGAYKIQVSSDGTNFTTVKTGTAASDTTTDDLIPISPGRYVRVLADSYRSIWTLNVYGE